MEVLHLLLLIGSPAFGLEVILLGGGWARFSRFWDIIGGVFSLSISIGILLVGTSILISYLLDLSVLFLCAVLFVETFSIGKIFSLIDTRKGGKESHYHGSKVTDAELKSMLKSRGLDRLASDSEED